MSMYGNGENPTRARSYSVSVQAASLPYANGEKRAGRPSYSVIVQTAEGSPRPQLAHLYEVGSRADQDVSLPILDIAQILVSAVAPDDPVAGLPLWPDNDRERRGRCGGTAAA